jgi:hypothetical protein
MQEQDGVGDGTVAVLAKPWLLGLAIVAYPTIPKPVPRSQVSMVWLPRLPKPLGCT